MRKVTRTVALSSTTLAMLALSTAPVAMAQTTATTPSTTTPIKHVVVIFQENVSFDHYFGTYPKAANPANEPPFYAAPNTPSVNGLTDSLLYHNPNLANPQRLDRSQAQTDDMDHGYTAEQKAFDGGLMDKFVQNTGQGSWPTKGQSPNTVMDYYDGNTVTAMWNYAQHFAMSDNSYDAEFGPSSPGAINLISGQTSGAVAYSAPSTDNGTQLSPSDSKFPSSTVSSTGVLTSDIDPYYDNASKNAATVAMTGKNVGDLLNAKNITWGWFEGGFADTSATHKDVGGISSADYIPHHEPFQYYKSTANPNHLPPSSVAMIGHTDQANHQYDLTSFWKAADSGNLPSVSFLKAPGYEDGHAGYSTPLDGQRFLVNTINHLESLPSWKNTAVIINYDDSDGWYDHQMGPIVNGSSDPAFDALVGKGNAGTATLGSQDRAGYGARLPMVVISPYAKRNYVANTVTDQTSILRFIEDNWNLGRIGNGSYDSLAGSLNNMFDFTSAPSDAKLMLDPTTGEPVTPDVSTFQNKGQIYMSVRDLTQSLDVSFRQEKNSIVFNYNSHDVVMPMHGMQATVDGNKVDLGAPMKTVKGALTLPVNNLAKALGVTPVTYDSSVLFKPNN